VYRIFTTPADAEAMKDSPAYAKLTSLVRVETVPLGNLDSNKYLASSDCYRLAARTAARNGSAALFLIPDMVFGDGGIRSILRLMGAGKRAVLVLGLRALKDSLIPELKAKFSLEESITIAPKDLVRLGSKHLHPIAENHMYDGPSPAINPSAVCWRIGQAGFLLHTFHLHPVAIYPFTRNLKFAGTIDDDLVEAAGLTREQVHVVTDSNEVVWFEISGRDQAIPTLPSKDLGRIVMWMGWTTSEYHRDLFRSSIRIHSDDQSSPDWKAGEARAKEITQRLLLEFSKSESNPLARVRSRIVKLERRAEAYLALRRTEPGFSLRMLPEDIAATTMSLGFRALRMAYRAARSLKQGSQLPRNSS